MILASAESGLRYAAHILFLTTRFRKIGKITLPG